MLGLFFGRPDEWFHLRQVVRFAEAGVGSVQREVARLAAAGILERVHRGNQVAYRADPQCPVFEELKALMVKTAGVADVLREALAPLADRIPIAFLYGSFARGEHRQSSDVDVMVVGEVSFGDVVAALYPTQSTLRREVNPTVYPLAELAEKLSAGHPFVTRVVAGEKVFLIGDEHELRRLGQQRTEVCTLRNFATGRCDRGLCHSGPVGPMSHTATMNNRPPIPAATGSTHTGPRQPVTQWTTAPMPKAIR